MFVLLMDIYTLAQIYATITTCITKLRTIYLFWDLNVSLTETRLSLIYFIMHPTSGTWCRSNLVAVSASEASQSYLISRVLAETLPTPSIYASINDVERRGKSGFSVFEMGKLLELIR